MMKNSGIVEVVEFKEASEEEIAGHEELGHSRCHRIQRGQQGRTK
jgi:hypothetical protein